MSRYQLTVKAGLHDRMDCPVSVRLPLSPGDKVGRVELRNAANRRRVPCQVNGAIDTEVRVTWIARHMRAGEEMTLVADVLPRRSHRAFAGAAGVVQLSDPADGKVNIAVRGEAFTTYHYEGLPARPCFHPVRGPGGRHLTRDWPMADGPEGETRDHKHHRSLWIAHGDMNGVDNWSEESGHGRQIHREFASLVSGPVYGQLIARNDWVSSEGEKVCEETRHVTFYNTPEDGRLVDFDIEFVPSEGDLVFGDTKEGGILSVRVATTMDGSRGGRIEISYGGLTEAESWGRRAAWCDYSGPVSGATVGLAIFDHLQSFRHPTYWHVRNYGLMTANPFGLSAFYNDPTRRGDHTLRAGERLWFHYRLYLHAGDARQARVAARYNDYVNPPTVEVKPA